MNEDIYIGQQSTYGGRLRSLNLSLEARRSHMYVIGKTGLGKSTFLRNMIIQDLEAGRGLAVLDPHGSLAEELLDDIPSSRSDDLVYFNPADTEKPIGFNIFTQGNNLDADIVRSTVVGSFKHLWHDSWGPRMEYVLSNTIQSILEAEPGSLLSCQRMLNDKLYRARIVSKLKDPVLINFWRQEFAGYSDRFRAEVIAPIQNKLGRLTTSPLLRNILGQVRSTINLRFMLDNRRILLANLSKGKIGEDNSSILGSLLVTAFHLSAMQRADEEESDRRDFTLYLDEFQNFGGDTFISTLSEARKFRLSLVLAHQYMNQLPVPLQHAVTGNVGTMVCFGISPEDADRLQKHFDPYNSDMLVSLDRGKACMRTTINGAYLEPFRVAIPPPPPPQHGHREMLTARSRLKYGRPREEIERKLARAFR